MAAPKKRAKTSFDETEPETVKKSTPSVRCFRGVKFAIRHPHTGIVFDPTVGSVAVEEVDNWLLCQVKAGYIEEVK